MVENEQNQNVVTETRRSMWEQTYKTEDYWAIWLAALLFAVAVICVFAWKPQVEKLPEYRAVMEKEMDRAGFRTIAYIEAQEKLESIQAKKQGLTATIYNLTDRPRKWSTNPLNSLYMSEKEAASRRAAAADRYERAQQRVEETRQEAERAEAAAEGANFENKELNQEARAAIADWRKARSELSNAKKAATVQPYNLIPSLIILGIVIMLFFAIGARFIGINLRQFFKGFPIIFVLAVLAYLIASQETMKTPG